MNSDIISRLKQCLTKAGLFEIPVDPAESLATYGFDSLTLALSVIEIEREFKVRFAPIEIKVEQFETLASIAKLVESKTTASGPV
jgi:D-alanine--poly(phosphoribitol) ligase subunit 2